MVQVKNMKQRSYIMLYFENDYCEGAHEAILKRLMETNMEKVPGYGPVSYTHLRAHET